MTPHPANSQSFIRNTNTFIGEEKRSMEPEVFEPVLVRYWDFHRRDEGAHVCQLRAPKSQQESEQRFVILGVHSELLGDGSGGAVQKFCVDQFTEHLGSDSRTRRDVLIRNHVVSENAEGQKIFPQFFCRAVDFFERYVSASLSPAEWKSLLKAIEPDLLLEKQLLAQSAETVATRQVEAERTKNTPQNLGREIAAALAQLAQKQ